MSWTIPRSFKVVLQDHPNNWGILFGPGDFDAFSTASINVLISRARKEIDGKMKYPAVFPVFGNLYKVGLNWLSDLELSLPSVDGLERILTFPLQGTTQGYFLDRIPFNSVTRQFEPDMNNLTMEIRAGHFQWREDELGDINRNQVNYRDVPFIATNNNVERAIGVKLLLKKKGYRHERTLKTEIENTDGATKIKRTDVFVPYYNLDERMQDIDITVSVWIPQ